MYISQAPEIPVPNTSDLPWGCCWQGRRSCPHPTAGARYQHRPRGWVCCHRQPPTPRWETPAEPPALACLFNRGTAQAQVPGPRPRRLQGWLAPRMRPGALKLRGGWGGRVQGEGMLRLAPASTGQIPACSGDPVENLTLLATSPPPHLWWFNTFNFKRP